MSAASFDEMRRILRDLPGPDLTAQTEVVRRQAELTKPPGSLGRLEEIAEWLDNFDADTETIFVAEADGGVIGFIHMELGDKGDLGAVGVVNLLYVDAAQQRRGTGRALMAAGAGWVLSQRRGPLVLSAFADNPYRHAYAAMGGREAKAVQRVIDGREIGSVLYLWDDPAVLLRA